LQWEIAGGPFPKEPANKKPTPTLRGNKGRDFLDIGLLSQPLHFGFTWQTLSLPGQKKDKKSIIHSS
jgi:hypothetical protein